MKSDTGHLVEDEFDLVIIGGGLVGASLAVAIEHSGLKALVVESEPSTSSKQPSYSERTVALTEGSRRIFDQLGLWETIRENQAEPIKDIHVSNRGRFGITHLSHKDVGTTALGYVVPTRVIGQVLWDRMQNADWLEIACPATVTDLVLSDSHHVVEVSPHERHSPCSDSRRAISAKLVVVADGGRSNLAAKCGFVTEENHYDQSAVLSFVSTDRDHHGRAYERFTIEGPLALLPSGNRRFAVVWTTLRSNLKSRLSLDDDQFASELQTAFGDRAGNFKQPSERKSYPLHRNCLTKPASRRTLFVGNAAHTVHPVAGQGFNLGLRDVATLAEMLLDRTISDIGSETLLCRYAARRVSDTKRVSYFTHGLIQLFSNENHALALFRNLALGTVELLPPMKRFLLKRTMGLAGKSFQLTSTGDDFHG